MMKIVIYFKTLKNMKTGALYNKEMIVSDVIIVGKEWFEEG